jgi:hypothetical protein
MRALVLIALGTTILGVCTPQLSAGLVTLNPVVDGDWFSSSVTTTNTQLRISGSPGFELRAGMEFQLLVPANATINSAILSLQRFGGQSNSTGGDVQFFLHGFSGDGALTNSDFQSSNPISGPYFSSYSPSTGFQFADLTAIDVTGLVQSLYASSDAFALFTLRSSSGFGNFLHGIGATEAGSSTQPSLTIDYTLNEVPEPSAVALFGMGAACLTGIMRRRRLAAHACA